jgi:hypothetical protein
MYIVITTKKPAAGAAHSVLKKPLPLQISGLIEEVGALQEEAKATAERIKVLQAQLKPYAEKVKQLVELVSKYADGRGINPDKVFTATTTNFLMQVGKAGTLRTVTDNELASHMLGRQLFFEKCTIGLGIIDSYLTPEQKLQVLKVERCVRGITLMRRIKAQGET